MLEHKRPFVRGTADDALRSVYQGWIVGHFFHGLSYSRDLEIKLWHYDANPDYPQKEFAGTELIIVEQGILHIEAVIGGTSHAVDLSGKNRDYVIFPPGTIKQVAVAEAPACGITVRWPSALGANKVVAR